jgi:hypothetical protein
MRKIGEILVEKGALSVSELTAGLDATRRDGGRLGTQLVRLGFVDEYLLLEALSEQFQVPSVSAQVLRRAHDKVRRLLPSGVASELLAVPFMLQGEQLKVAMADPGDLNKRKEISVRLRRRIEPYVATEAGIVGALLDLDPNDPRLATYGRKGSAEVAARKDLEPADVFIDFQTFSEKLAEAEEPNDVARLLYRLAQSIFHNPAVFAVSKGQVRGWLGARTGESENVVKDFKAPLDVASVFTEAAVNDGFSGAVPTSPINLELVNVFDLDADEHVEVLPVRLGGREVAFLFGIVARRGTGVTLAHLREAVGMAGEALEALLLKRGLQD